MSENTTTPATDTTADTKTWVKTLQDSEKARASAERNSKRASTLLWDGAIGAIREWDTNSDPDGVSLYNEVKDALGEHRKGDASKIRAVALAVRDHSLDLNEYPSLSKAYNAATDLSKRAPERAEEDDAAEKAVSAIEVPAEPSTPEDAAKILLKTGVTTASRLLVEAMGREDGPAHRALLRALSTEISNTAKALHDEAKAAEREQRAKDKAEASEKIAKVKAEKAEKSADAPKPKPAADKAPKAAPAKAAPAKAKPKPVKKAAPVEAQSDLFADLDDEAAPAKAAPAKAAPTKAAPTKAAPTKAKPVRRPVRAAK